MNYLTNLETSKQYLSNIHEIFGHAIYFILAAQVQSNNQVNGAKTRCSARKNKALTN